MASIGFERAQRRDVSSPDLSETHHSQLLYAFHLILFKILKDNKKSLNNKDTLDKKSLQNIHLLRFTIIWHVPNS